MKSRNKILFLQSIEYYGEDYCDIKISDYNFRGVKKLKNISPYRWIVGNNIDIAPGRGKGTLIIGHFEFQITYAWGGRGKPNGGYNDRTSYTVRIKGKNLKENIESIETHIIFDEYGSLNRKIPIREYYKNMGINSPEEYQEYLIKMKRNFDNMEASDDDAPLMKKMRKLLKSAYSKRGIARNVNSMRGQWEKNGFVEQKRFMKIIETDNLRKSK